MDYIKELKKKYDEEEALYFKNHVDLGCERFNDVGRVISKARLDQLGALINLLKAKSREDWINVKDRFPPKRTLVLVKEWLDGPENFYKRSFFGLKWLNKGGSKKAEIKPSDVWKFI
jgi:hypothetical protein